MWLRWSEARGEGFTPRPSLSWRRIVNWPERPTGKVSTFLTGMKIRFESSPCYYVTISILFWQIVQLRYSTDRTCRSARMSFSMYTQHAGHVTGILTTAHSHPHAIIGDEMFLGVFEKFQDELRHVCFCVRMEQFGSHRTDFNEISYFSIFLKSFEENQVVLKWNKNDECFTWGQMYILCQISLSSF